MSSCELFELYVFKRPKALFNNRRLYLHQDMLLKLMVNGRYQIQSEKSKISSFTKKLNSAIEIKALNKKLTNHSDRKTLMKQLKQAKIQE